MPSAAPHRQSRVTVQLTRDRHATSVVVRGELDALTIPEFDGILGGVIALDDGAVTVDLSAVDFMGAAGARSLLEARRELSALGRTLEVVDAPLPVARLLAIIGWDGVERPV